MPPKGAEKKPAASKAPVKAPAEKKEAGKKTAATGDKKKRGKTRKETYSSYIYKGEPSTSERGEWSWSSASTAQLVNSIS